MELELAAADAAAATAAAAVRHWPDSAEHEFDEMRRHEERAAVAAAAGDERPSSAAATAATMAERVSQRRVFSLAMFQALRETKENAMKDRKKYQTEVERIKEAVRLRNLARKGLAPQIGQCY